MRSAGAASPTRVRIAPRRGRLSLGEDDWQAEGVIFPRTALVGPFILDATEVTVERWEHCVRAGACRAIDDSEPGSPATGIDAKEAERFCRFENGRLPRGDEWLLAAMGAEGRRFPWGPTGLVCRRAAFGLETGPCAHGGGPELAGARPDGATPEELARPRGQRRGSVRPRSVTEATWPEAALFAHDPRWS